MDQEGDREALGKSSRRFYLRRERLAGLLAQLPAEIFPEISRWAGCPLPATLLALQFVTGQLTRECVLPVFSPQKCGSAVLTPRRARIRLSAAIVRRSRQSVGHSPGLAVVRYFLSRIGASPARPYPADPGAPGPLPGFWRSATVHVPAQKDCHQNRANLASSDKARRGTGWHSGAASPQPILDRFPASNSRTWPRWRRCSPGPLTHSN